MNKWRFIDLRDTPPSIHQNLEEVLVASVSDTPVLFLSQPQETVGCGLDTKIEKDVNIGFCKANNIPVYRAKVHGKSVYYSGKDLRGRVVIRSNFPLIANKALAKRLLIKSLLASYNSLGIVASQTPQTDNVMVEGRKISSIGFRVDESPTDESPTMVFYFTILKDFDYDKAEKAIISPKNMRENLTTIKEQLGREVTVDEVKDALKQGFKRVLGVEFLDDELTQEEQRLLAQEIEKWSSIES